MRNKVEDAFVPVLTVMPDFGFSPFLWLVESPDQRGVGANCCDGSFWDESFPMSEGLWQKFADWALAFESMNFYSDRPQDPDWDWLAFHARGLCLARWLKEEVGDAFRVVYLKPCEDSNRRLDERREVLFDGSLRPLPPLRSPRPEPRQFCLHIVSGGQSGADRAALDFAIRHGYAHGGWAPRGREAEDGPIPLKYQLTELPEGGYRQRTRRNVADSDGTLILNLGQLDGGTLATQNFAQQLTKPWLVVPLDAGSTGELVNRALDWMRAHSIQKLNVAGPRENKRPGIYRRACMFLVRLDRAARSQPPVLITNESP